MITHRTSNRTILSLIGGAAAIAVAMRNPGLALVIAEANRALLRMLSTSRDHGLTPPKQPG